MNETDSTTSNLRRFLPSARALRDDVRKSVNMDLPLNGDLAMTALTGLIGRLTQATDDAYILSLADSLRAGTYTTDKEKITAVLFVAGQLVAFLESETGTREGGQAWQSTVSDIAGLSERIAAEVRRTVGEAMSGVKDR
ncbi:MAG: hypothetical protein ACYC5O_08355 [Anaerolineae bacterium]